ncbi:MAG: hypothetical protein ACOC97_00525 [Myxococcota bacterium]
MVQRDPTGDRTSAVIDQLVGPNFDERARRTVERKRARMHATLLHRPRGVAKTQPRGRRRSERFSDTG